MRGALTVKKKSVLLLLSLVLILLMPGVKGIPLENTDVSALLSLLPELMSWKLSEEPLEYVPESLFEYINGAAEIYLSYNFEKLIVAQYGRKDSPASLTLEIYDMGNEKNSFGIYSVERFPESNFLTLGNGGYVEEGTLNFIVSKYYIKILCFDCEESSEMILKQFSQEILKKVEGKESLPLILNSFPEEGLINYSQKFILRNFLGQSFLHDGYLATYKLGDLEFDCFLIEAKNEEEAENMFKKYLDYYTRNSQTIQESSLGFHIKSNYYKNVFMAGVGNYICGVLKINDGSEEIGEKYIGVLVDNIKKML